LDECFVYKPCANRQNNGSILCLNVTTAPESNLVDSDLTNYAGFNITGAGCGVTFSVKDNDAADTYPAGYYAGFKISSSSLLSGSVGAWLLLPLTTMALR
jgi:hypothetical protein